MPSPNDTGTPLQTLVFVAKIMNYIVEDTREGETASHRLKQAGLMQYIYMMHLNNQKISVTTLCERIQAPRQVVVDILKSLELRDLVTYSATLHESGRGRVHLYSLTPKALSL